MIDPDEKALRDATEALGAVVADVRRRRGRDFVRRLSAGTILDYIDGERVGHPLDRMSEHLAEVGLKGMKPAPKEKQGSRGPFPHFNGPLYEPSIDHGRLTKQLDRVREMMRDGQWRTLSEIEKITRDPPASISAQLRHLRKKRFGSWIVDKQRRGANSGLWEYRLREGNCHERP